MPIRKRIIIRFILFPLGIALLVAVLIFQEGTAISIDLLITPGATLSPFERLAKPTLPAVPLQADRGAQTFWLWCLPCHGDRGQGLTDEFRETYPPDHQNCWERGCHGKRTYEDGFSIPEWVPALIGSNAQINKFQTAASLYAYIRFAMPYWKPGVITDEEAWDVTAFLLRENNLWSGSEIDNSNAGEIFLSDQIPTPTLSPTLPPTVTRTVSSGEIDHEQPAIWKIPLIIFIVCTIVLLLFVYRWVSSYENETQ